MPQRVGIVRISQGILAGSNAASAAPSDASNGVAVPKNKRNEYAHLVTTKGSTAHFAVWGYSPEVGEWVELDRFELSQTHGESQALKGAIAFERLCEQRLDANTSASGLNTFWGFSE